MHRVDVVPWSMATMYRTVTRLPSVRLVGRVTARATAARGPCDAHSLVASPPVSQLAGDRPGRVLHLGDQRGPRHAGRAADPVHRAGQPDGPHHQPAVAADGGGHPGDAHAHLPDLEGPAAL